MGALATAMSVGVLCSPAQADPGQPAPLRGSTAGSDVVKDSYIVVYKDSIPATARTRVESRAKAGGGRLSHRYTAGVRGFSATLSASGLAEVRRDPNVAFVAVDTQVRLDASGSWGQDRINQRRLPLNNDYRSNGSGAGVHAYVIDSGIRATHGEFGSRATLDANFVGDGRSDDCLGHGSHVAGTVGGATVGVARSVRIHAVRVFGCSRTTTSAIIIAGVDWVTANAQRPAVINMSLGGGSNAAIDSAVQAAINAGIPAAVSAGNDGADACNNSPARLAAAITVANSDRNDARWTTSNFGICVDLFAPGTSIVSASHLSDTGTATMTGTSMASPHVAGVVALYLQRHRTATPAQVRAAIQSHGTGGVITDNRAAPNLLLNSVFGSEHDYTGDNVSDHAVWRPSNGNWFIRGLNAIQWGIAGDRPVPADYNGDTFSDIAVWRPSTGTWFVRNGATVQWGVNGDVPVPGDYNADGVTDFAVWRPSTGTWFIRGISTTQWGVAGDVPVPGDYNGDGTTDLAVWRPSTGTWFVLGISTTQWGVAGDVPVPGNYSGNGLTEIAVWRPSTGTWFVAGQWSVQWGIAGDVPKTGDFNGDGMTDVAVWRPSDGNWFVRLISTTQWGVSGDIPV